MKKYTLIYFGVTLFVLSIFLPPISDACQFGGGCTVIEYIRIGLEYTGLVVFVIGLIIITFGLFRHHLKSRNK